MTNLPTLACQTRTVPIGEAAERPVVIAEELQRTITQVEESVHETTINNVFGRGSKRKT